MNKIVDHTNNRINETITRLQIVESCNISIDKYTQVKITDKIKLDALFGLMYFRGFLYVNLHLTDLASPEYLSIDETLYPMRKQIAFRQYNPKKPHRYGRLWKSLNDARLPYTYKSVPYAPKPHALEIDLDYII